MFEKELVEKDPLCAAEYQRLFQPGQSGLRDGLKRWIFYMGWQARSKHVATFTEDEIQWFMDHFRDNNDSDVVDGILFEMRKGVE